MMSSSANIVCSYANDYICSAQLWWKTARRQWTQMKVKRVQYTNYQWPQVFKRILKRIRFESITQNRSPECMNAKKEVGGHKAKRDHIVWGSPSPLCSVVNFRVYAYFVFHSFQALLLFCLLRLLRRSRVQLVFVALSFPRVLCLIACRCCRSSYCSIYRNLNYQTIKKNALE